MLSLIQSNCVKGKPLSQRMGRRAGAAAAVARDCKGFNGPMLRNSVAIWAALALLAAIVICPPGAVAAEPSGQTAAGAEAAPGPDDTATAGQDQKKPAAKAEGGDDGDEMPADGDELDDASTASGDELLLFEDMPVVVSASRQAQPINWLSVPVSVLDAKDIHYSGLKSIPEMLQFVPGVDVLMLDRNRYAVGVRGLHDEFSDRTLVLIDGRVANNPAFGGMEWFRLPLLVEDIKRIEVVRGPGGAAWGANALTGAINIITKDPEDSLGALLSTTVNHFGDTYSHIRWAAKEGKWSWRTSVGYQQQQSSDDALDDDSFFARDFSRGWIFDGKVIYRPGKQTKMSFGLAHSHVDAGDFELMTYFPRKDYRLETSRLFARMEHTGPDDRKGYLQWFGNYSASKVPNMLDRYCLIENDLEGQLEIPYGDHRLSIGGNIRQFQANIRSDSPQELVIRSEPAEEQWVGLFVMDRWKTTDRLVLEAQVRGDWYSETHLDWSGRGSALYALDEAKDHIARVSASKAFRAPSVGFRKASAQRGPIPPIPPLPPGLFAVNLMEPAGDLKNEQTWSLEAGYAGKMAKGLTVRLDSYYQRFEDLIGSRVFPEPPPVTGFRRFFALENLEGADSWGTEAEVALKGKRGKISAWYAYNAFEANRDGQTVRAFAPARHKTGLTGRLFLPKETTVNSNYRYTTSTASDQAGALDAHPTHRLDLNVAKRFWKDNAELAVGVNDIFNKDHHPVFGAGSVTAHETPGRTFFVRLQVKF